MQDNRFVDWVLNPQSNYAQFWLHWLAESKDNVSIAEEAKQFLLAIKLAEVKENREIDHQAIEGIWNAIKEGIEERPPTLRASRRHFLWWSAAAVVAGLVITLAVMTFTRNQGAVLTANIEEQHPSSGAEMVRYNGSTENELVFLPDGSRIVLKQGAKIKYGRLMAGAKREVHLEGDAFFDVAKDPGKPFYIYTKKLVVRVLGTSFRVNASGTSEAVFVKSGKVSVYLKGQDLEKAAPRILLPNHSCKYSDTQKELIEDVSFNAKELQLVSAEPASFSFDDSPLDSVMQRVENMYAIPVHYDRAVFKNCFLTITIGNESLESMLQIITKTIGASYSLSDDGVYLKGSGCK